VILVIDLGTTGVRCIAYSDEWHSVASNYLNLKHETPDPGMFVQDLKDILEKNGHRAGSHVEASRSAQGSVSGHYQPARIPCGLG